MPEHIDHGYSLIYYNKAIQGFSIDYKYIVNINYVMDPEHMCDLMDKIKKLDTVVERKFEQKVSYSYFQNLNKNINAAELSKDLDKINIPVRSGKKYQDIRKPELIIDEAEIPTAPNPVQSNTVASAMPPETKDISNNKNETPKEEKKQHQPQQKQKQNNPKQQKNKTDQQPNPPTNKKDPATENTDLPEKAEPVQENKNKTQPILTVDDADIDML